MTTILGLNGVPFSGHDPAAALIVDGRVVAAVEEERISRVKRAMNLPPTGAIKEVLDIAGLEAGDVDLVACPWLPRAMGVSEKKAKEDFLYWLCEHGFGVAQDLRVCFIEHHVAHACSGLAFVPGGIKGQRTGVLVLDGSGESTGGAAFVYDDELTQVWQLAQDSSLGIYYEAIAHYLGFTWGEEGKAMGLAAYGRDLELRIPGWPDLRIDAPLQDWNPSEGSPRHHHMALREQLVDEFRHLHGEFLTFNRRSDIALSAQQFVADRVLAYAEELLDNASILVLSGGVALNCAINAQVATRCRELGARLVIPPPASDTGVALGAAIAASGDPSAITPVSDPFLGRDYKPDAIAREMHAHDLRVEAVDVSELSARLWDKSLICGWFEGRSEIGPRALGKRSIIARADTIAIRDRLNVLKGRESWRPLAPSLTAAEFYRSFGDSTPSPHMLINAMVLGHSIERLKGVVHADGSSRPQVVEDQEPYRALLQALGAVGGTEAVICTSFNRSGEPIVYSPTDALRSARAMGLDCLVGDGWYVSL